MVFSKNDFSLGHFGKELYEFWKLYRYDEAVMISNYFWGSNMASILFCNSDFSLIGGSEKRVFEVKCGKEDGGQGD